MWKLKQYTYIKKKQNKRARCQLNVHKRVKLWMCVALDFRCLNAETNELMYEIAFDAVLLFLLCFYFLFLFSFVSFVFWDPLKLYSRLLRTFEVKFRCSVQSLGLSSDLSLNVNFWRLKLTWMRTVCVWFPLFIFFTNSVNTQNRNS